MMLLPMPKYMLALQGREALQLLRGMRLCRFFNLWKISLKVLLNGSASTTSNIGMMCEVLAGSMITSMLAFVSR